ncbi:hypothetical protein J0S82_009057, partial [Galemys pyrenaicus]
MAQSRRVRDVLNTHWLVRNHINYSDFTRFQEFKVIFQFFSQNDDECSPLPSKFIRDMSCVTIPYRYISSTDLVSMVQSYHLICGDSNLDYKGDQHTSFENTNFSSAHRDHPDTTHFLDGLEGQEQELVSWMRWQKDAVQCFKQHGSTGIASF